MAVKEKIKPVNKELKSEFITKYVDYHQPRNEKVREKDIKYYNSSIEDVFTLNNGTEYYAVRKPYLKKSFCFGYGYCLQSTEEESNSAFSMAEKARNDASYFINENLEEINRKIAMLTYNLIDSYEERKIYFEEQYKADILSYGSQFKTPYLYREYKDFNLVNITYVEEEQDKDWINRYAVRKATKEDMETILEHLKQSRERLIKRLNTYLKKYGLEHLNIWTYLRD